MNSVDNSPAQVIPCRLCRWSFR